MIKYFVISLIALLGLHYQTFAQANSCKAIQYEDKNQVTPEPIVLKSLSGVIVIKASDDSVVPLAEACVGLYSEDGKKLISRFEANDDGTFSKSRIRNGKYRLLIRDLFGAFCTANIPIEIRDNSPRGTKLAVTLKIEGIDECSDWEVETS